MKPAKDMLLWRWPTPLHEGRLVRRYERFIAEIRLLDGRDIRAHCVNPGRMEGLVVPGARVWVSEASPERALPWTWELIELDGVMIGANTALPNQLVRTLFESLITTPARSRSALFSNITAVKPEQAFGRGHRVDFVLERRGAPHYVEVKNCHLVYPDRRGYFPDSHSERASKHVEALARLAKKGVAASVLFTLQRLDVEAIRPSALHDPDFTRALRRAVRDGVTVHAVRLAPTLEGVRFDAEVPVDVEPYDAKLLEDWAAALAPASGWVRKDGRVAGNVSPRSSRRGRARS